MAAKKTKKKAGSSKAGYDLCVSMLKRNPKIEYKAVKASADRKRISIYPIVYGRAKAALGLVSVAKRGQGKAKRAAAAAAQSGAKRRGPGRPRKNPVAAVAGVSGIESIISQIKNTERERDRAVHVLQKIRDLIESAV